MIDDLSRDLDAADYDRERAEVRWLLTSIGVLTVVMLIGLTFRALT